MHRTSGPIASSLGGRYYGAVLGSSRLYRSLAVLVLALLTGGVLTAGARQQPERDTDSAVTPWIETWAPEAVKAAAQLRPTGVTATYRIDADVLLPPVLYTVGFPAGTQYVRNRSSPISKSNGIGLLVTVPPAGTNTPSSHVPPKVTC